MTQMNFHSDVPELFESIRSRTRPSKPLMAGPAGLSYGDLFDRVERLTSLYRKLNFALGDRVALISDDDVAVVTLFMSLLRNGLTAVILNPAATPSELEVLLTAADVRAAFVDADILARCDVRPFMEPDAALIEVRRATEERRGRLIDKLGLGFRRNGAGVNADARAYPALLDELPPAKDLPAQIPASTVAYILFTSGTTSRPKGVEITHGNLFAQMATFVRQYGYTRESRLLNLLPLHHTDGLTQGPVVAFTAGATVVRPMRFRVDILPALLDSIYTDRITHFITVPSVLALIANLAEDYEDAFVAEDFRFVISTAAYLDEKLWADFEARFRTRVVNVYGLTETVCESLYCGPDEATRKLGTVGKPVDCEARIVDDHGRDVPQGQMGELILRGEHIMAGYFCMPEETAAVLKDGWFYTGDLASMDQDGFYRIIGRKKNVIITAGMNVYPEDVTSVLRGMPGVLDAVTFGMPDETWGERVVSCVVPAPGASLSVEQVAAHFLERASREKLPREIHIVDDLPRGPAGKVIIGEVKQLVAGKSVHQIETGMADGMEARLLSVAASVFKTPADMLSLNSDPDNTKGWNSLAHVELLVALEQEFDIRMAPRDIMAIRSLRDASAVLSEKLQRQESRHRPG